MAIGNSWPSVEGQCRQELPLLVMDGQCQQGLPLLVKDDQCQRGWSLLVKDSQKGLIEWFWGELPSQMAMFPPSPQISL